MNGKPWTEADTEILKHLAGYAYDHEIANVTGHAIDTVQRRRSMLGLPAYHGAATQTVAKRLDFLSRN